MKKNKYFQRISLLGVVMVISAIPFLLVPATTHAISINFSDNDFLSGASWGTMTVTATDADTLQINYEAAPDTVIPTGSQVTGFGFTFLSSPTGILNPSNGDFTGDRDDLNWIVLNNLNSIPNPANGDEFVPPITKFDFLFGVTEGNPNNINPPGIMPGEFDIYYIDFTGIFDDLTTVDLTSFVELTGIRLQSLPNDINGGSLFLVGNGDGNGGGQQQVPEPGTLILLGSGLIGFALYRLKFLRK